MRTSDESHFKVKEEEYKQQTFTHLWKVHKQTSQCMTNRHIDDLNACNPVMHIIQCKQSENKKYQINKLERA